MILPGGAGCRFPRVHRITQRADFQRVYRFGQRIETRFFVLYALENALQNHRLGITASRKMGGAVVRNRLKRRFRELFRRCPFITDSKWDLVINTKRAAVLCEFHLLGREYRSALETLGRS